MAAAGVINPRSHLEERSAFYATAPPDGAFIHFRFFLQALCLQVPSLAAFATGLVPSRWPLFADIVFHIVLCGGP